MQRITCYKTKDGIIHNDEYLAIKHANELYGNTLLQIVKELLTVQKYSDMTKFIENNLDRFVAIQHLRLDIELAPEED